MGPTNLATPEIGNRYFGIGPVNGRINAVAFGAKNSQTIYAGGAQGGLWKSTNSGATWSWLSSTWTELAVNCIVVDPVDTNTIYVGRGDYQGSITGSDGIMKSTDGGQTWSEIATASMGNVGVPSILMDPTNDQVLVAGTGDALNSGALYLSTNGGQTWTRTYTGQGGDNPLFPTLAASLPSGGKVRFYAVEAGQATSNGSNGRVLVSDNHGKSWSVIPSPVQNSSAALVAYAVAASPTNPNNVYVLDSQSQALYGSANQGASWTNLSANLPVGPTLNNKPNYNFSQSGYDYHLECGNRVTKGKNADVLYLGEIDVLESLDQGNSWISIGGPSYSSSGSISHNDQHCLAVDPANPNIAIFGNDGGVYQVSYNATNNVNTVTSLNANLGNTMFYKIACHPSLSNYVMGGTQDNATPFSNGNLANWLSCSGGDGGGCAINQANPLIAYGSGENLNVFRTIDFWNTEENISPTVGNGENLPFVAPVVLDPNYQGYLYTGTNYLYRWDDDFHIWFKDLGGADLTNDTPNYNATIRAIAVAPSDSTRIYTGSSDAALSISTDAGADWAFLLVENYVNAGITSISVNPSNPNDCLVGYSGSGIRHLYRLTLASIGYSWTYTPVTGSGTTALPDAPLNAIARDLDDPQNTWYVATDVGIFQTNNAGQSWTNTSFAYGLPDVIVEDLVAVPGTRYLNAGTYGRGMWRLLMPLNGVNLASFSISPSSVTAGYGAVGLVTLSKPAPSGGTVITLGGTSSAIYPNEVVVPAGSISASFPIVTTAGTASYNATITATQLTDVKSASLSVSGVAVQSIQFVPATVVGGTSETATVTLNGNAPPGGLEVNLSSNNANAKVQSSVTVQAGESTASFPITTNPVATSFTAKIQATLGSSTQTANLTVEPAQLSGLTLSASTVVGGSDTVITGTLTFTGPTPAAGTVVKLQSSKPSAAKVPATITVKLTGSATTQTFTVTHLKVKSPVGVTIQATSGSASYTAGLSIAPFQLISMVITPGQVAGGNNATGTVTLNAAPGTGSGVISVQLSTPQTFVTVPATATVPVGQVSSTYTIKTKVVTQDNLAVIQGAVGSTTQQASLNVVVTSLAGIAVSPTSVIGSSSTVVTGAVQLTGPAPAGGIVVYLTSSDNAVASMPASVTVAAGQTIKSFTVTHAKVTQQVGVTLTAKYGATIKTTILSVGTGL
jgi:hypothetical protein